MSTPLDDEYFGWLAAKVGADSTRNPARSYIRLVHQLYRTPFVWTVHNDDNRAEDGKELREIFLQESGMQTQPGWLELDCSLLELFIALAHRASFETEGLPEEWFWHFLSNLGLSRYSDFVYSNYNMRTENDVKEILDIFMFRKYGFEGHGGLFPHRAAAQDQRRVELWYQLQSYVLEGNGISGA